ncbi:hypothetical protein HY989_05965 [Candidatus Micrarchaeota archaeon]|nr:hypothetical protein [Candidatus Micrarchaeota archaeon]
MNSMLLVLMAIVTYFFFSVGATFLAFLSCVVLVMFLFSSQGSQNNAHGGSTVAHGATHGGVQPIIIGGNQPAAHFPNKISFRPNFPGDPDGDEWISGRFGAWVVLFGRMLKKFFGSNDTKSDSGHH